jgi:hypothetical protein
MGSQSRDGAGEEKQGEPAPPKRCKSALRLLLILFLVFLEAVVMVEILMHL